MHLGVALAVLVLRRAWRSDQRGVHHRVRLEQQPLADEQVVKHREHFLGEFVALQQVARPQDRALVGQSAVPAQARELPEQRHVVQRLFHRRIREREPLLHEVNAQHRLYRKRRATLLTFGDIRHDQLDQRRPRNHALHLREELSLARALGRQVQVQIGLLNDSDCEHVVGPVMQTIP